MKKLWIALALVMAGCAVQTNSPSVTMRGATFSVELATTPQQWEAGLMNRTNMSASHGMLFIFPDEQPRTFWMKDTDIALDMVFIGSDYRVVSIAHSAQPCTQNPCALYPSHAPAKYVLEINGGAADRIGLKAGDTVRISGISS